jgi:serine/threonine protein kinase
MNMERLRAGDPEQIGPWQIVNRLGSGGMGVVYMGTNGTHAAAVKVVRDHLLEDPASRTRLAREVEMLKRVKSEYVAEIVGSDTKGNNAWIATNYVDGPSLGVLVDNKGPLSESDWAHFAHGLLSALAAIHEVGVIHRDIKPSNILMDKSGPKLIDFGIAFSAGATSLTGTGLVAGTPAWLAPEQFTSNEITIAVDVFSAGSTLYYAATGITPWGDENSSIATIMHNLITQELDFAKVTSFQKQILELLLDKNPKSRQNAKRILSEIEKNSKSVVFQTRAPMAPRKIEKKKLKKLITGGAILGIFLLVGLLLWAPSIERNKVYGWTASVEGEANSQKGSGQEFEVYLCDQGVIEESVTISQEGPKELQAKTTVVVIEGDLRCGDQFDAVVVKGTFPKISGSSTLAVEGRTQTGYDFNYGFSVRVVSK